MPENKEATYQPIAFDAIQIGLASPEKIREWSRGEVKKPETIINVLGIIGGFCNAIFTISTVIISIINDRLIILDIIKLFSLKEVIVLLI